MNELIQDLENGKVDVIIAKDISRIGRHNAKTLQFVENIRDTDKKQSDMEEITSQSFNELLRDKNGINKGVSKSNSKF